MPKSSPDTILGPLDELVATDNVGHLRSQFTAYAPPLNWGAWVEIAAHAGSVRYNISYRVNGDTLVHGLVNFYGELGWETRMFKDSITIETGNAWASVKICFQGSPFGSVVNGRVY